jgi:hypothetical protein
MQIPTYNEEALKELNETVDVGLGGEDWDLVCAYPSRVGEFCDAYECEQLSANAKVAFMQLIVASYDEYLKEQASDVELQQRLFDLLNVDFDLHRDTILYWSSLEHDDLFSPFAISSLMRDIWQRHSKDA